jgi:hypothetical protein
MVQGRRFRESLSFDQPDNEDREGKWAQTDACI